MQGGPGSTPSQGTRPHVPQLRVLMPQPKVPRATTKTWHSQINKYIKKPNQTKNQQQQTRNKGSLLLFLFPNEAELRLKCSPQILLYHSPHMGLGSLTFLNWGVTWAEGRFFSHRSRIASAINLVLTNLFARTCVRSTRKNISNIDPMFTLLANTCVTDSQPPCSNSNFMNQCVYI